VPIVEVELGGASAGRVECVSFGKAVPLWSSSLAVAGHLPHSGHQAGTATSTFYDVRDNLRRSLAKMLARAQTQTIASAKANIP
jgi:hypothetical protein